MSDTSAGTLVDPADHDHLAAILERRAALASSPAALAARAAAVAEVAAAPAQLSALEPPNAVPDDVADEDVDRVPLDEVPGLKVRAAAAKVGDELRRIVVDGVSHEIIVRRPTRREFQEYFDASADPARAADGCWNLVVQCALWPAVDRIRLSRDALPALPSKVVGELETWVGATVASEVVLSAALTDEVLDGLFMSRAELAQLLQQYPHRGQLRHVNFRVSPEGDDEETAGVIVKRPTRPVYDALMRALKGSDSKATALYDTALSCIVVPESEGERRDLLDVRPGIPGGVFKAIVDMGGSTSKATAKKL